MPDFVRPGRGGGVELKTEFLILYATLGGGGRRVLVGGSLFPAHECECMHVHWSITMEKGGWIFALSLLCVGKRRKVHNYNLLLSFSIVLFLLLQ